VAIAPDLLSVWAPAVAHQGYSGERVGAAIGKLPPDQITADLNAVADYVKKLPACNGKVCVWASRGRWTNVSLRDQPQGSVGAFVCYGTAPRPSHSQHPGPVYGFYAGADARVNASIPATQEQMKAAGKFYEPVTYEGADHGFMRAGAQPDAKEPNKKAPPRLGSS